MLTRRDYLIGSGATVAGLTLGANVRTAVAESARAGIRVGMCDWSMKRYDPTVFELAKEIGLDGVEVSIGFPKDGLQLRRPEIQKAYLDAARKAGLTIPSVAMGLLNEVPLMSEPRAALWVADTIEATRNLGARCILLAFFGKHLLEEKNTIDMQRVTDALVELAPRAEKAGVILGLESYLSAEGALKIIDQVKSKAVQVYYDVYNSGVTRGYDVVKELKLLGRDRICQVHFKEGSSMLGGSKQIDWSAIVAALKEIHYPGWIVLETQSPNDLVSDTRTNLACVRKLFGAST